MTKNFKTYMEKMRRAVFCEVTYIKSSREFQIISPNGGVVRVKNGKFQELNFSSTRVANSILKAKGEKIEQIWKQFPKGRIVLGFTLDQMQEILNVGNLVNGE